MKGNQPLCEPTKHSALNTCMQGETRQVSSMLDREKSGWQTILFSSCQHAPCRAPAGSQSASSAGRWCSQTCICPGNADPRVQPSTSEASAGRWMGGEDHDTLTVHWQTVVPQAAQGELQLKECIAAFPVTPNCGAPPPLCNDCFVFTYFSENSNTHFEK